MNMKVQIFSQKFPLGRLYLEINSREKFMILEEHTEPLASLSSCKDPSSCFVDIMLL